jgi:UTP--glucose-1-phosphate uridylyltransferase
MSGLDACVAKMEREGIAPEAIEVFAHYYEQLAAGETGMVAEDEIEPLESLPRYDELTETDAPLDEVVVVKLNGGLGTSMGMTGPKSLLPVKDGLTFLDVIARQVLALRSASGARLPLVLMNSFATRSASLDALPDEIEVDVPVDFVQSKEPKILADTLEPAEWPPNPELEWCPPGHGDLYTSLQSSGMLERLLDEGYRYAFVSNVDNLGAVLEPRILAWFAASGAPFASEAIDRTEADKKGGHLARRNTSPPTLILRESAQVADADQDAFQDTGRHRFFNANNLWIDLGALAELLDSSGPVLGLPLIVNRKTVDPSDATSPAVIQLETAMGAAIEVFDGATALHVPRERFLPVKTTSDLLVLRSDAYRLGDDFRVALDGRDAAPLVSLSGDFKLVGDFDARFPSGPPSLREADRLTVDGDVTFGKDVVVRGTARVDGPAQVPDGEVLS